MGHVDRHTMKVAVTDITLAHCYPVMYLNLLKKQLYEITILYATYNSCYHTIDGQSPAQLWEQINRYLQ